MARWVCSSYSTAATALRSLSLSALLAALLLACLGWFLLLGRLATGLHGLGCYLALLFFFFFLSLSSFSFSLIIAGRYIHPHSKIRRPRRTPSIPGLFKLTKNGPLLASRIYVRFRRTSIMPYNHFGIIPYTPYAHVRTHIHV